MKNAKYKNWGFSLIELSIVILIASIFASSMINILGKKTVVDKNAETREKMARIGEALKVYWHAGDRHYLPCPTGLKTGLDREGLGSGDTAGNGDCSNYEAFYDGGYQIFSGAVPVIELGLPPQYMFDAWGNRIVYVVDQGLATVWNDSTYSNISIFGKEYVAGGGTINDSPNFSYITRLPLKKEIGKTYRFCNDKDTDRDVSDYSVLIPDCPAFLLISHGPNGYLSFNSYGTGPKTDTFGKTANEKENTPVDSDASFDKNFVIAPPNLDTKVSSLNNSNYFDDIFYYKSMTYFTGVTPPAGTCTGGC